MEGNGVIDMTCPVTQFCVSFVAVCVAAIGMERFVSAWNMHYISGTLNIIIIIMHLYVLWTLPGTCSIHIHSQWHTASFPEVNTKERVKKNELFEIFWFQCMT